MTVTLRTAVVNDAVAIQALNRDAMGYDYSLPQTLTALQDALASEDEVVVVAVDDSLVVGYCHAQLYRLLYADLMVNILGVAVDSRARRQGVGLALMDSIGSWARSRGATAARLVSGESRTGAHRFYSQAGFTPTKRQLNFRRQLSIQPPTG
ncbi:MAG: GNAT family N-acetyltransferase [Propionibacteriaceae bacterium]|nr:GNAT family N-acetyltransferase [Propionibacteriaceae bacterium]